MWLPKQYLELIIRKQDDLERRVKRLELMSLEEAKNKIASLGNGKTSLEEAVLTIEEIVNKPTGTR